MNMKQKTVATSFSIKGVGLHSGLDVQLNIKPAEPNTGIIFKRIDLENQPEIKLEPQSIRNNNQVLRCTTIGETPDCVYTVEHFLSALYGLGVTNLIVEINSEELPGLDGSAKGFLEEFQKHGLEEQSEDVCPIYLKEPITVEHKGSSITAYPANELEIHYTLSYPHPLLKAQHVSFVVDEDLYCQEIAPCRTFCLESEVEQLKKNGLGKGANYQNTLVMGESGVIDNQFRFDDELARHKVLDFIGDLYILGRPLKAKVFAIKSGHQLNMALLKKIDEQIQTSQSLRSDEMVAALGSELDIHEIKKILPHRYPFLLVDKILKLEKGKKAIGLKNVTINEPFFQGHFPSRPVMPGVLMVEAMAQTGGAVVLTSQGHRGKVAFFMAVDKVKFRKVVSPGDQLVMEVEVVRDRARTAQMHGVARVGGEVVAEADMMFSFVDESYLGGSF